MKKPILSLLIMSGLLLHTPIFAATMQQIIQQQAKHELKRLNKLDADGYQSKLLMQQTVQIDLNGDQFSDSAALLTFCERENCHPTTVSYLLIAALGKDNNDFVFKDKAFPRHQTDSSTLTVKNHTLIVKGLRYGETDPSCCASVSYIEKYKWNRKKSKLMAQ